MTDESCELETRLLACDAVCHSIRRHREQGEPDPFETTAIERVEKFLSVPQPPVLRAALEPVLALRGEPVAAAH